MAKDKGLKTNAMRILDKNKIPYKVNYYECDEFIDGIHIADMLSQSYDCTFKTLVAVGKSGENSILLPALVIINLLYLGESLSVLEMFLCIFLMF